MKRLASLKQHQHQPNSNNNSNKRGKSTDLNLFRHETDHEYLLDDKELLNKLRYSETVADLCTQELNNNNNSSKLTTKEQLQAENGSCQSDENEKDVDDSAMGSNVSRFSDKGLSGRRTQSSGKFKIFLFKLKFCKTIK